ncbi:MAG: NAD(P)/FAD-dependent oxidoreductase, partial [Zetaproteobacteria bacterium]
MARVVIMGAGIGGLPAAYEMKDMLDKIGGNHEVIVVNNTDYFHFVPSNPWVAVGWRTREDISLDLNTLLSRRGIGFIAKGAKKIDAENNRVVLEDDSTVDYDYLIVATGPRLAFELVEGLGPEKYTQSICHVDHAERAYEAFEAFCKDPGPVVLGAVQGVSCFGPAYEFAMILDTELR